MGDKIAFVFDTNFIIQNHDLETVTQKLMEHDFVAYVTQVAIDERIAQECNKQKEKYDELEKIKDKFCDFASIKITKKYEDSTDRRKLKKYVKKKMGKCKRLWSSKLGQSVLLCRLYHY